MWRAFSGLSKKDQLILMIFVLCATVFLFYLVFALATGNIGEHIDWPDSSLSRYGELQKYRYMEYEDLSIRLVFPGTDYGICVGGEELYTTENGTAFCYEDGLYMIAGLLPAAEAVSSFWGTDSALRAIYGGSGTSAVMFRERKTDHGYRNTLEADYLAGIYASEQTEFYMLSYATILPTGERIIIATLTDKAEKLRSCKTLLDKAFQTIFTTMEDTETGEGTREATDRILEGENEEGIGVAHEALSAHGTHETIKEQTEAEAYYLAFPEAGDLSVTCDCPKDISSEICIFYFDYERIDTTPEKAELISPTGDSYVPTYCNDNKDGRIRFEIEKPTDGTWTLHLSRDGLYGTYILDVLPREAYYATYKPEDWEGEPHS